MADIGSQWQNGSLRTCQEHFGSAHVRTFLARNMIEANLDNQGPTVILGTVPGCWHEIGVAMAALVAAQAGWQSVYLGANVPPEELAFAADMKDAQVIAISISFPNNPTKVSQQLRQLRTAVGNDTIILAGGASLSVVSDALTEIEAHQCATFAELQTQLNRLRYQG
jgi:methanogenic corrinoid protein MtbC1